jgi:hypothetical protein
MALINNLHVVSSTGFGIGSQGFGAAVTVIFSDKWVLGHFW